MLTHNDYFYQWYFSYSRTLRLVEKSVSFIYEFGAFGYKMLLKINVKFLHPVTLRNSECLIYIFFRKEIISVFCTWSVLWLHGIYYRTMFCKFSYSCCWHCLCSWYCSGFMLEITVKQWFMLPLKRLIYKVREVVGPIFTNVWGFNF